MTQTIEVTRHVRCPVEESSAFITDPHHLLCKLSTLSRCRFIESTDDGELWDVFLDSGTVHLGGRVLVTSPTETGCTGTQSGEPGTPSMPWSSRTVKAAA